MLTILPNQGTSDCSYNNSSLLGLNTSQMGVFPDSTPYKQSASELRQYIVNLEVTRRLRDLADVNFTRSPQANDILAYDHTTGFWNYSILSPGESFKINARSRLIFCRCFSAFLTIFSAFSGLVTVSACIIRAKSLLAWWSNDFIPASWQQQYSTSPPKHILGLEIAGDGDGSGVDRLTRLGACHR
jgi:hypothetical protein